MSNASALGLMREAWLGSLAGASVDVLVVGGGVTGAGVALDAAARGLSVLLVEQDDFASGTSSRSSKLIHGGLRYLEHGDVPLVREALRERELLLHRLAPHLVRPVRFFYPLRHGVWERWYLETGLATYDMLAGTWRGPTRHRHRTTAETAAEAPSLATSRLWGAMEFGDAQADDARLVTTLLRTAADHGAACCAGVALTELLLEGSQVAGGRLLDRASGRRFDVSARVVINATGVWTPEIEALAGAAVRPVTLARSKGVHVVLPRDRLRSRPGWILRAGSSVLFVIPWEESWLVGTTDTPWRGPLSDPQPTSTDIRYVLAQLNAVVRPSEQVSPDDVLGAFAGLRPLVARGPRRRTRSPATARLSRRHVVRMPRPGLVTVAGGKLTTYRVMARDAVDLATRTSGLDVASSATHDLPLLGAEWTSDQRRRWAGHSARRLLDDARLDWLAGRYGSSALELLDLVQDRPDLASPIPGAPRHLLVEAVHATVFEGAQCVADVLERRTRIAFTTPDSGEAAAAIAGVMRDALGVAGGR